MFKIYISTSSFGTTNNDIFKLLDNSNYIYKLNPYGRKMTADEINKNAGSFDAIIAGNEDLSTLIKESKTLKIISRVGVGLDSVPLEACKVKKIKVCYTPNPVISAVAELSLSLILACSRSIVPTNNLLKKKEWKRQIGRELNESIIGIVGFGRIGKKVAKLLSIFNPKCILIYDTISNDNEINNLAKSGLNIKYAELIELLSLSDFISIHVPFNKNTRNIISDNELKLMKKNAYIINTSRGGLIDETALYNVLKNKKIAGAALDVFENEPYIGPLAELDNTILTSHIGSYTSACRTKMEIQALNEVIRFYNNESLENEVPKIEYNNQTT